jgi:transposase
MKHNSTTVGIDLAKQIFLLVGMDTPGKIVWRQRLTRHALVPLLAQLPPVTLGREAWGGAHYWARQVCQHGPTVKRMAPQFVQPYGKSNKNDRRAAEAIAAAVTRPPRRCVPSKDSAQPDVQALHRVRERLSGARTALSQDVHG